MKRRKKGVRRVWVSFYKGRPYIARWSMRRGIVAWLSEKEGRELSSNVRPYDLVPVKESKR